MVAVHADAKSERIADAKSERLVTLLSSVGLERGERLLDLGLESRLVVDEGHKLRVVETLEEHTGDLAGKTRLVDLDEGVEALAEDLLSLRRRRIDKHLHELLLVHGRRRHRRHSLRSRSRSASGRLAGHALLRLLGHGTLLLAGLSAPHHHSTTTTTTSSSSSPTTTLHLHLFLLGGGGRAEATMVHMARRR